MKTETVVKSILYTFTGVPVAMLLFYFGYLGFLALKYPPPSCDNTNPIFENNAYDSRAYKAELIRLLKETKEEKTGFWFTNYIDANHIAVTIQNDKVCAKGYLTIDKWEGFMKHLKDVKGKSYGGRLIGLKYRLVDDADNPEILLVSVRDIVD